MIKDEQQQKDNNSLTPRFASSDPDGYIFSKLCFLTLSLEVSDNRRTLHILHVIKRFCIYDDKGIGYISQGGLVIHKAIATTEEPGPPVQNRDHYSAS
jgi:hypothetical protein